jgi:hypothetical protein
VCVCACVCVCVPQAVATVLHHARNAIIADTKKCTYMFQLAGGWNFWRRSVWWLRSCGMFFSLRERYQYFAGKFCLHLQGGPFFLLFCSAILLLFLIAAFRNFLRQPFHYFLPFVFLKCYFFISVALAVSGCSILLTWFSIHTDLFFPQLLFSVIITYAIGHAVVQLVEALRYKPAVRGFDSRWWHNPSGRTMTLEVTQPLTEMSTRNIAWGVKAAGA